MSARNIRWTERLGLLSELLQPGTSRWSGVHELITELRQEFGYRRLALRWPASGAAEVNVCCPDSEPLELSAESLSKIQGKSQGIIVDAESDQRRFAAMRIPPHAVGVLLAEREDWPAEEEAAFTNLAATLSRSPALPKWFGLPDRGLIDRLHDGATLAGRLAHDYDNLWTGILGFAELTIPTLRPGSNEQQYIQEVATIGQRGIQMTAQLHQFSRSGAVKPMPASVVNSLTREQARLKQTMNGRVRWSIDIPNELPLVSIENGSLQVVLGHLLDNAVESMPNGGSLKITASMQNLTAAEAGRFLGDVRPGNYVLVRITDAGTGIKDDVRAKLFYQPFFTTKARHRGLGLAIVYRTLFVHRGGIVIETEGEKGTSVQVALPLTPAPPAAVPDRATITTHTGVH